jgi:hypothetical protein
MAMLMNEGIVTEWITCEAQQQRIDPERNTQVVRDLQRQGAFTLIFIIRGPGPLTGLPRKIIPAILSVSSQ